MMSLDLQRRSKRRLTLRYLKPDGTTLLQPTAKVGINVSSRYSFCRIFFILECKSALHCACRTESRRYIAGSSQPYPFACKSHFHTEYAVHSCFIRFTQFHGGSGVFNKHSNLIGGESALVGAYIRQQPQWRPNENTNMLCNRLNSW